RPDPEIHLPVGRRGKTLAARDCGAQAAVRASGHRLMCGISGIHFTDRSRQVDAARIAAMSAALRHRGPDDEGTYIDGNIGLGHQRLSILDLSSAGRQPMTTPDRRYWIVYNGEIYNYRELRADLERRG